MITLRMYAQHKEIELGEFAGGRFYTNREQQEHIERRVIFEQPISQDLKENYSMSVAKPLLLKLCYVV